jgi:hypothetical protein
MLRSTGLRAIAAITVIVASEITLAQENNLLSFMEQVFSQSLIDEVTEAPARVIVRGIQADTGKRVGLGWLMICERSSQGGETLIVQDRALKTDDRWGSLAPGTCDALLAAARNRKEAQGR